MSSDDQIKSIFKNQTIFITGATGFVGKVLLEKLLRECGSLKRIYILIRSRKGKDLKERYKEIFEHSCFDVIKSKNVNVEEKVLWIGGDCQKALLGLGDSDLEILKKETNFVFHLAANVRFDQSLKEAALNVQATRDVLEISKQIPNLKAFVFVSTAYSNCIHSRIKEEVYEPPMSCELLLNLVRECDGTVLGNITPHLLGKWPNPYVYTKCISESLVKAANECFPTTIVRPGIITNAVEEPLEGWIDNIHGPIGIVLGAGYGVIRTSHGRRNCVANIVPVDYVCNCVLAATWKTVKHKISKTRVYNYIRHSNKPLTWGAFADFNMSTYWELAPKDIIWYNTYTLREHKLVNDIYQVLLHTIPAYLADGVLWCLRKPRIAVKTCAKINKILFLISYFATRSWTFDDDNVTNLWNELDERDRKSFRFRNEALEWNNYLHGCVKGIKLFITHEYVDTSFRKSVKLATFFVMHYAVVLLFWYIVFKILLFVLSMFF